MTTHHCVSCNKDGNPTAVLTCPHCGSEDTFDKRLPEWRCSGCKEDRALYQSVCVECQKKLLGVALGRIFFGDDTVDPDDFDPEEDFGSSSHRLFNGCFSRYPL